MTAEYKEIWTKVHISQTTNIYRGGSGEVQAEERKRVKLEKYCCSGGSKA